MTLGDAPSIPLYQTKYGVQRTMMCTSRNPTLAKAIAKAPVLSGMEIQTEQGARVFRKFKQGAPITNGFALNQTWFQSFKGPNQTELHVVNMNAYNMITPFFDQDNSHMSSFCGDIVSESLGRDARQKK